ncbi:MAG: GTPase Era, partial [Rhodospirillales bacterium 12-54-5]
ETERYEEKEGVIEVHQAIIVQNERQKMIVIGKGGAMLKAIGMAARREIGKAAGAPCRTFLFVKIREDWKDKPEAYQYLGLEFRK